MTEIFTTVSPDLADKIASKLLDKYSIGDFSRFMDEPADFDPTAHADLAAVIREIIRQADNVATEDR